MTDFDYEATVETESAEFTFSGDNPRVVSAQAARMPVLMHKDQVQDRIDLETPVQRYLQKITQEEEKNRKQLRPPRNRRD